VKPMHLCRCPTASHMLPMPEAGAASACARSGTRGRSRWEPLLARGEPSISGGPLSWQDYEMVQQLDGGSEDVAQLLRDAKAALKRSLRVDYYGLLEVDSEASDTDIKKAYKRMALKYHPDKSSADERDDATKASPTACPANWRLPLSCVAAHAGRCWRLTDRHGFDLGLAGVAPLQMFKLVGEAHAVLSDPVKRRKYDQGYSLEEMEQVGGRRLDAPLLEIPITASAASWQAPIHVLYSMHARALCHHPLGSAGASFGMACSRVAVVRAGR
jgi:DnaJ domain